MPVYTPIPMGWHSPYLNSFSTPIYFPNKARPYPRYPSDYASPIHSADSSSSLSDGSFTTEDPKYSEHLHQCQSRIHIADEPPLVHVPPFYRGHPGMGRVPVLSIDTSSSSSYPAPAHMYGGFSMHVVPMSASPVFSPTRGRPRSASRHKVANYKSTFV